MKYKCVISDLDLTLLQQGDSLSEKTKEVLDKLRKKGILFVPASGRPLCSYPEDVLAVSGLRYLITSNGAMIYDLLEERPLWCSKVPEEVAQRLCGLLRSCPVAYECFIDGKAYASKAYWENPSAFATGNELIEGYVERTREPVEDMEVFLLEHRKNLDGIDVVVREEDKAHFRKQIEETFDNVYITSSTRHLIEISSMESGKHRAVARLTEKLDIPMEAVIAFGDGENDCELLQAAGLGIAVENAVPECKNAADTITGTHHEDGVADALIKIFEL